MPLYVADYLADTSHLSTIEHGAYMLLIMHYWQQGGLPADEARLARIARMSPEEWSNAQAMLADLFEPGWRHGRIDAELAIAADRLEARQTAGSKGGKASARAKREKQASNAEANVEHCSSNASVLLPAKSNQSQSQSHIPEANASGADAPADPSIAEREFFRRGREVLGPKAGGQLAKLKTHHGGNVALARATIETASTKDRPAEYVAAVIRGPPASRPLTEHQRRQAETNDVRSELREFAMGGGGGGEVDWLLSDHPGERSQGVRGGSGAVVLDLPSERRGEGH